MGEYVAANTFGARAAFLYEKHSKSYTKYGAASIAEEKAAIAQKILQRMQFYCMAGRIGV